MFERPASPVSLDCEFKAAASAPVQISSEALPAETASPSSASVLAQLAVLSNADLVDVVEAAMMRRLSGHGIIPRTQSAAPAAHSQHDPESRHASVSKFPKKIGKGMPAPSGKLPRRQIRSKQPQAAPMARLKRVCGETFETPTRGTRRASERTPAKEESAAKSRRAVEAVTSSDVTSRKGPAPRMESSGVRAATPPPPNVAEKRQRSTPGSAKPAKKVAKPREFAARIPPANSCDADGPSNSARLGSSARSKAAMASLSGCGGDSATVDGAHGVEDLLPGTGASLSGCDCDCEFGCICGVESYDKCGGGRHSQKRRRDDARLKDLQQHKGYCQGL
mgnify:CR=1 FL=1